MLGARCPMMDFRPSIQDGNKDILAFILYNLQILSRKELILSILIIETN
jgi:hypothetical protein